MKISILILGTILTLSAGAKTCAPDCTPPAGCGTSCYYEDCDSPHTFNRTIKALPHSFHDVATDACSVPPTVSTLPFMVNTNTYNQIPADVTGTYYTCQGKTRSNPPCPTTP